MTQDRGKAQRNLGRMLLRKLRRSSGIVSQLESEIRVCPIVVASDIKRRNADQYGESVIRKIIDLAYARIQRMKVRALNLLYNIYPRSRRVVQSLPKGKRKFLRNRGGYVHRPQHA